VAAEVSAADEKFEIVSSGRYRCSPRATPAFTRDGIVCLPVSGLEPARLAIAWRRGDRRPAVRDFIRASRDAAADSPRNSATG
jgi:DNA-binding transcriptional LysR family regulator